MYSIEILDYNHKAVYRGQKYYDDDHNDVNRQADYVTSSVVNPKEQDKLRCFLINVCGLKNRLNCPDFKEFLLSHDLSMLTETKFNDVDIFVICDEFCALGYFILHKNRNKFSIHRSGGIIVFIRKKFPKTV